MMLPLDVNLVNPIHHGKNFIYPGSFGPDRSNQSLMQFDHISKWRDYLLTLQIDDTRVPRIHCDAYHDALRALLLAWVEPAIVQSAELQALRSLEGALCGVYFQLLYERELPRRRKVKLEAFRPGLGQFLNFMTECDDLPEALHSKSTRGPGSALDTIRNRLAHGNPLNTLPCGGLFESVRDVIVYAHRNHPEIVLSAPKVGGMQSRD
jgi:hypothetical protein